jgi:predicted Zn finger-like uncharacterized protein
VRFACDRCKTRYSIADERVRGKILKIRCKTCANVITVKEGMELPAELAEPAPTSRPEWPASGGGAAAAERPERGDRAYRPTTMAPQSTVGGGGVAPLTPAPKPAPALGAAFASAMAAPPAPPQLEDEWYVSRDGEQHGPFGLHDAQAWVSQQPYEAELHCWCEGFDDWLPVDRIAHFRGLRARPLPQVTPAPSASLSPPASPASPGLAQSRQVSGPLPLLRSPTRPTGANPVVPSGAGAAMASAAAPAVEDQPQFAATMAALAGEPASPAAARVASPAPALGNGRASFDAGDLGNQGFSTDTGASGRRAIGSSSPIPAMDHGSASAAAAASSSASLPAAGDDDLEFGEVSRVVRIADIGKTARPQASRAVSTPGVHRTGANEVVSPEMAAGLSGFRPPPASPRPGALPTAAGALPPLAPLAGGDTARAEVPLVIPAAQRRNHALLLGLVAAGLIGAGVGAMVLLQTEEPTDAALLSLGGGNVSDMTIRPDDPRRGSGSAGGSAEVTPPAGTGAKPTGGGGVAIRRPTGGSVATPGAGAETGTGGKVETAPALGSTTPLSGDEVETMSQRNSSGLQRCYEQALKKDIFLEVKSIKVTISIDTSGIVSSVSMSSHADHALGLCMISRIRNWRFRQSSRGLDAKFTVAFGRT